jgi:SPW repeat
MHGIVRKEENMSSHVTQRAGADGTGVTAPAAPSAGYLAPPAGRSLPAQATVALGLLAGVWVAISPWFLVLQAPQAGNATANDLITGLAVAALAVFAISGVRGFLGLEVASLLLGIWLIISPFILAAKFSIQAPMYWSNIWAGALVAVLALASLAGLRRHPG